MYGSSEAAKSAREKARQLALQRALLEQARPVMSVAPVAAGGPLPCCCCLFSGVLAEERSQQASVAAGINGDPLNLVRAREKSGGSEGSIDSPDEQLPIP